MSLANKYPCILPDHCNPSTFLSGRVFAEVTSFVPRQVQQGAVDWTLLPVIWTLYIHVQLCVSACEKGGGLGGGVLKGVRGWRHKAAFYDGCITSYSVHTCTVLWAYYFSFVLLHFTLSFKTLAKVLSRQYFNGVYVQYFVVLFSWLLLY